MILGLGSDLIDIRRIEKTIARFGDRFLERCFTEAERGEGVPTALHFRRDYANGLPQGGMC